MNNDIQSGQSPMFGQYVKLIATREIVEWKTYDPKPQMLEISLPQGASVESQARAAPAAGNDHEFEVDRPAVADGHMDLRLQLAE